MARNGGPPIPRAHWVLLLLTVVVLLVELAFDGYVRHVGAEGVGRPVASHGAPALAGAGPVLASAPDGGLASRSICLLYTSPSPRDRQKSRMPSSA